MCVQSIFSRCMVMSKRLSMTLHSYAVAEKEVICLQLPVYHQRFFDLSFKC